MYQELLAGIINCEALGERLVHYSEQAHAFRDYDTLQELALMLSNLPSETYRLIGQYYAALGVCRNGTGSIDVAQNTLESLACVGPTKYRAKSLLLLSAISQVNNKTDDAFRFYEETVRVETFSSATILAIKGIAVLKAREDYHKHALKDLERFYPIARYASPHVYFDYLNSLAVELLAVGRIEEARYLSNIVLASPYSFAYPEWRETRDEIELKAYRLSRSTVSFAQKPIRQNVLYLPERSYDTEEYSPNPFQAQGIVVKLNTWKNKMVKEPNDDQNDDKPSLELDKMTNKDFLIEIVQRTSNKDISEKKLRKILEYVLEVESEPED